MAIFGPFCFNSVLHTQCHDYSSPLRCIATFVFGRGRSKEVLHVKLCVFVSHGGLMWSCRHHHDNYRARICSSCNCVLIALERPQSSIWLLMVCAGYDCIAKSAKLWHGLRDLYWSHAQMFMHMIAQGDVQTLKESLHWKLTLGRKCLATPGNQTSVSGVMVRYSDQLSYIRSPCVVFMDQSWMWMCSLAHTIAMGPLLF